MRLVIISGLSGSGKSIALHMLEDQGFYCVDNLPVGLLTAFANSISNKSEDQKQNYAVGIDVRNNPQDLKQFPEWLQQLKKSTFDCQTIFLRAQVDTLIKRFSETRRKHPLTSKSTALPEALELELKLLEPVTANADLFIDTTHTSVHQLRELISQRVGNSHSNQMSLVFQSFGFKHGVPNDADFVFDVRCLPNPYWEASLRPMTGRDEPVADFLEQDSRTMDFVSQLKEMLEQWFTCFEKENRSYLTVAIGCTGGQHRSVYVVEKLGAFFKQQHQHIMVRHRELS